MILATTEHVVLSIPGWHWLILLSWFAILITIDVAVLHKKDHEASIRSAAIQTVVWILLGVGLGLAIWQIYGGTAGAEYFSGYVIEKSLSIDNVFVWSIILSYFAIPAKFQHRVLFWGVFGCLILRAVFIFAGVGILNRFEFALVLLGIFLLFTGCKIAFGGEDDAFDPETSKLIGLIRRKIPVSQHLNGHKLFAKEGGRRVVTMLFIALVAVEFTDVLFAVDSVPAILAVARDPFIIFASNAAAILGLRALYFVFDALKDKFSLLNKALGAILFLVGVKMIIGPEELFGHDWLGIHVPTGLSLLIILSLLSAGIIASLVIEQPIEELEELELVEELEEIKRGQPHE